jgi:hypothetical protein
MTELKRSLLGNLQGRVLEIEPVTGRNSAIYPTDIGGIGVKPNQ